jgi:hypothetical protein
VICGGLQDNGSFGTMSFTRDVLGIRNDASWKMHWDDGQYVAVDPTDWRTIYSEGTERHLPRGRSHRAQRHVTPRHTPKHRQFAGNDRQSARRGGRSQTGARQLDYAVPHFAS